MANLFRKIKPLYFFVSFAIGLLIVYVFTPPPEVVMKFPSPYNSGNIIYKDTNNMCYKYDASKSACPSDKNLIKAQPIFT